MEQHLQEIKIENNARDVDTRLGGALVAFYLHLSLWFSNVEPDLIKLNNNV